MASSDRLATLASELTEWEFSARVRSYALLIFRPAGNGAGALGFRTSALDVDALARAHAARARKEFEVALLVKAANNPYSDRISIGRARNCDIVLRDPSVSKLHAHVRIDAETRAVHLIDLGSHNGISVDAERLVAQAPHVVHVGSAIELGSVRAELVDSTALYFALR